MTAAGFAACWFAVGAALPPVRSLDDVAAALSEPMTDDKAEAVASFLKRIQPRGADLAKGALRPPNSKGLLAWVVAADPAAKAAVSIKGGATVDLPPLGKTGLHAAVMKTPAIAEYLFKYSVDGKTVGEGQAQVESYQLPPECLPKPGVPQGKLIPYLKWRESKVYPETTRDWWLYVPAQYDPNGPPAALMVFLDGGGYSHGEGNATVVFDNLIQAKKMPVTIGVFVDPGRGRTTRSDEYDTCTPRFAEFLEKDILPVVAAQYRFSTDPKLHAICGASSGGSGAFTAAWHRPDMFHRVLSHIGSYCDFRPLAKYPTLGGKVHPDVNDLGAWKTAHDYPAMIRKLKKTPKPLRIFLQDGERDLNNDLGDWPLANRQMAKALEYAGYKYRFVMGEGFHSGKHGRAIFPESLIWLWADD